MCGRYVSPEEAAIERIWHLGRQNWVPWFIEAFKPSYNVAPTQTVPVLRMVEGEIQVTGMRWGLIPAFAKGVAGKYATFNAQAATLDQKPAYRVPWRRGQRCLIPATGFYEWQVLPDGTKQPWYFACADQEVFGFAGLWDSSTPEGGEPVLSCTLITLEASPFMASINTNFRGEHREPAILRPEDWQSWLAGTPEEARACLRQYPDDLRSAWPVSKRVNSARNDDPSLAAAIA